MNIFYLSHCPSRSAKYQYNKHVVKMVLETAQLLATAHHQLGEQYGYDTSYVPYKQTHKNHPSAIWVRQSFENYMWAYEHMIALGKEYTRRYGKTHLTIEKCRDVFYNAPKGISNKPFTSPPQCMPEEHHCDSTVEAYWNYYINDKQNICSSKEILHTQILETI